jgi:hypothetical protein
LIHHWFLSDTSMVPMVPAKKKMNWVAESYRNYKYIYIIFLYIPPNHSVSLVEITTRHIEN